MSLSKCMHCGSDDSITSITIDPDGAFRHKHENVVNNTIDHSVEVKGYMIAPAEIQSISTQSCGFGEKVHECIIRFKNGEVINIFDTTLEELLKILRD